MKILVVNQVVNHNQCPVESRYQVNMSQSNSTTMDSWEFAPSKLPDKVQHRDRVERLTHESYLCGFQG